MNRGTMEKKITKIEKKLAIQDITPSPKLYLIMRGKKAENEEEAHEIRRLYLQWVERVGKAFKSKRVTLEQVLDSTPEPFRSGIVIALRKRIS